MHGSERAFRDLVDDLPDLVCRFTPDGTLLYVNRAYADYFGRSREELRGVNFLSLVPSDTLPDAVAALHRIAELSPARPTRLSEHRGGDREDGSRWQEWVDKAIFDDVGKLVDLLAVGRDITDRREAQAAAHYFARHDSLTGLVNRRCIMEALEDTVRVSAETDRPFGLLYVDLNDFKHINDEFGHQAGDAVLRDVASALRHCVRGSDSAGRIGGDEFVVICAGVTQLEALHEVSRRMRVCLASMERPLSASFGGVISRPGESAEELLHRADAAMYQAKRQRLGRAVSD